jgi:hypothetical protein
MYLEHILNELINYQISYKNYDRNVQNLENKSYQIQNVLIISINSRTKFLDTNLRTNLLIF